MNTADPGFPFVCVLKSGGRYGPEHVHELLTGLRRYQPHARLVCLTDSDDLGPEIEVVRLKHGLPGWFSKLEIFTLPYPAFLYVDLDVIFTDSVSVEVPEGLWILRGFKGWGVNSSVLLVRGDFSRLLHAFVQNARALMVEYASKDKWGDQDYIRDSGMITGYVQDLSPHLVGSWKSTLRYRLGLLSNVPAILIFHGNPKPDQLRLSYISPGVIRLWSWPYLLHHSFHRIKEWWRR